MEVELDHRRIAYLLAAELLCDHRPVLKVLRGGKARALLDARIRRELARRGITPPTPDRPQAP